jgi:hypothetical protein
VPGGKYKVVASPKRVNNGNERELDTAHPDSMPKTVPKDMPSLGWN